MSSTNRDDELKVALSSAGVIFLRMTSDEHQQIESTWRDRYGQAFVNGARHRHGTKAVHEFLSQPETDWLFVPFLGRVAGTPVSLDGPSLRAFRCEGSLQELSEFSGVEFFISPPDLSWTFVRTHEDFAFGGPYFVRTEWLEEMQDSGDPMTKRRRRRRKW